MKKMLKLLLVIGLFLGNVSISFAKDTIEQHYLPSVSLGWPIVSAQPLNSVTIEVDGKDYICTSSLGSSSMFNVYSVDEDKYVFNYKLNLQRQIWKHVVDKNNKVYAIGNGITQYDPYTNTMKKIGDFSMFDEVLGFTGCVDDNNNVYAGTYDTGKIIRYNPEKDEMTDMGIVDPNAYYLRSLEYVNGYLYATVVGEKAKNTTVFKLNSSDCSIVKEVDVPQSDYYQVADIKTMYSVSAAGDLLIYWCQTESGAMMLVYDTTIDSFIDIGFRGTYSGLYASPPKDGKVYFISASKLYGIDLATKKYFETGIPVKNFSAFYGVGWVTLENNPDFPGKSLALFSNQNGHPNFINVETGKQLQVETEGFVKTKVKINSMEADPAGTLHLGGYQGDRVSIYDLTTHETKEFATGQIEGSVAYQGKHYYGVYTGAWFVRYDPQVHVKDGMRLDHIQKLGEQQDRPYVLKGADDKIFIGSFPDYMQLGGALSWYDLKTEKMTVIRNVVQDQAVYGLAYRDGLVYGSTYINGGLGSQPVAKRAKMFIYDVENNKKIKEFEPQIPGVENPVLIGDVAFDSQGKLWAVADYTLFSIDPDTEKVMDVLSFGIEPESSFRTVTYMRFDEKGYLYVDINGLKVVNTKDLTYRDLAPLIGTSGKTGLYTIASDGNLYYRSDQDTGTSNLRMIPISDFPVSVENLSEARSFMENKVALSLDSTYANVKGKPQKIDTINPQMKPIIEDGYTLLPVRFMAEAFGAEVGWTCKTGTVSINKDGLQAEIKVGEHEITVNGRTMTLDMPVVIRGGRVMLPLRAIANLFGETVDYHNGIILISKEQEIPNENLRNYIEVYFKYYIKENYEADLDAETKRLYMEEQISYLNGRRVEIPNGSFEEVPSLIEPLPGFSLMSALGKNCSVTISKDKVFDGKQSLKVIDTSLNDLTGCESQYIPINPAKNHKLFVGVYLEVIRTDYAVELYNQNKELIDKIVVGGSLNMSPGEWNLMETDIPADKYPNAKYIKLQLYTPLTFTSQCYYDGLTLIEY